MRFMAWEGIKNSSTGHFQKEKDIFRSHFIISRELCFANVNVFLVSPSLHACLLILLS
jgi:hypothetical protein